MERRGQVSGPGMSFSGRVSCKQEAMIQSITQKKIPSYFTYTKLSLTLHIDFLPLADRQEEGHLLKR